MQCRDLPDRLPGGPRLIQHAEPVTGVEQTPVDAAEVGIVIGEEYSDRRVHDSTCSGSRASTRVPPCERPDTLKEPPTASTRSRMPVKPAPGA